MVNIKASRSRKGRYLTRAKYLHIFVKLLIQSDPYFQARCYDAFVTPMQYLGPIVFRSRI